MKIGKKFVAGVLVVVTVVIGFVASQTLKPIMAEEDNYHLSILGQEVERDNQIPIELKIDKPKEESLTFKYEGIHFLDDEIFDGVQEGYDDSQVFMTEASDTESQMFVSESENSLVVHFNVQLLPDHDAFTLSLWNGDQKLAEVSKEGIEVTPIEETDAEEPADLEPIIQPFAIELPDPVNEVNVANSADFKTAVENTAVDRINITAGFALEDFSSDFVLDRNLTIVGVGDTAPLITATSSNSRVINISESTTEKKLIFSNLQFDGRNTSTGYGLVRGGNTNWTVIFDDFLPNSDNRQRLANGDASVVISGNHTINTNRTEYIIADKVTFDDAHIDSLAGLNRYIAVSRELHFTNGTVITGEVSNSIFDTNQDASVIQIDGRSHLTIKNTYTGTGANGAIFNVTNNETKVNILGDPELKTNEGNTTVDFSTTSRGTADDGGIINFDLAEWTGGPVYMNFKDYVNVTFHSLHENDSTPALMIQAAGAQFNVDNHSIVNFIGESESNSRAAVMRFRRSGSSEFNLSNNSVMSITKKSGRASAIRMNGGGNGIKVESGSKFFITSNGDGTARNGDTDGGAGAANVNTALTFINERGTGSSNPQNKVADYFTINGEDSAVKIDAKSGAAIDAGFDTDVTAGPGTFFEAKGRTNGGPMFRTANGALEFEMNAPMYYDFRNNAENGGDIFGSQQNGAYDSSIVAHFTSQNSDVSFWANELWQNLDGTPTYDRTLVDYKLEGSDLSLVESPDAEFTAGFGGMNTSVNKFTRMSANNATPIIDGIRQATDADKSLYIFGSVQEGFDDDGARIIRPLWDDEAQMVVEIKEPGKAAYTVQGTSVGGPETIYGDADQQGFVKVPLDDYLPVGTTVKVLQAWRGEADSDPGERHNTPQEDIDAVPTMTVLDVTPPTPTTVTGDQVTNASKTIKGTGEAGATVLVKVNGEFLPETATVDAEGNWEYTFANAPQPGNTVQVYLRDSAAAVDLADRPATNTDDGNINPETDLPYHDAVFRGVTTYTVLDSVIDEATVTKAVESSSVTATGVGDTLTYTIDVSNDEADDGTSRPWNNVVLTDVLHEDFVEDGILASVMINDQAAGDKATIETGENGERILTVQLGDLNNGESVKVTFAAVVGPGAVGKIINNKAVATGDTSLEGHQLVRESEVVPNPGGEVFGTLALKEAPTVIDFGTGYIDGKDTRIDNPTYTGDLIVTDNRGDFRNPWKITAQLTTPLTTIDGSGEVLVDAIRYKNGDTEIPLNSEAQEIITGKNTKDEENISEGWSPEGDGFKLFVSKNNRTALGEYHAEILFTLSDVPGE